MPGEKSVRQLHKQRDRFKRVLGQGHATSVGYPRDAHALDEATPTAATKPAVVKCWARAGLRVWETRHS